MQIAERTVASFHYTLTDDAGNGYRWALSAQRDVGGNLVVYHYTSEVGLPVGADGTAIGMGGGLARSGVRCLPEVRRA